MSAVAAFNWSPLRTSGQALATAQTWWWVLAAVVGAAVGGGLALRGRAPKQQHRGKLLAQARQRSDWPQVQLLLNQLTTAYPQRDIQEQLRAYGTAAGKAQYGGETFTCDEQAAVEALT